MSASNKNYSYRRRRPFVGLSYKSYRKITSYISCSNISHTFWNIPKHNVNENTFKTHLWICLRNAEMDYGKFSFSVCFLNGRLLVIVSFYCVPMVQNISLTELSMMCCIGFDGGDTLYQCEVGCIELNWRKLKCWNKSLKIQFVFWLKINLIFSYKNYFS